MLSSLSYPQIRFGDFGLSRVRKTEGLSSTLQTTDKTNGTPIYCAPEMLINPIEQIKKGNNSNNKTIYNIQ